ncbi:MAG: biotin--[acetyl-CoA-carboxylase] ligase [Saprospiraceae bacterium]|nr:biotin--[acetyl-CoA-carboxylase] ligase [Saprospiraceae bacterium]
MNSIGNVIIHLEETSSTNLYAQNLISSNKQAEGIIVLADFQSEGRGQGNNKWKSEKSSNLLMSLIVLPVFLTPVNQFYLNMAVCISVVRALEHVTGLVVNLKWPNDILINRKKISGILIQNSLGNNQINSSVIGIGINVNQKNFSEQLLHATSIAVETGKDSVIKDVLDVLIDNLRIFYYHLQNSKLEEIRKMYMNYLFGINEKVAMERKSGLKFTGILQGVSTTGELIVEENENLQKYRHGEVRIVI